MANSNETCECSGCTAAAVSNVKVKGQSRNVALCGHHRKFNNPLRLKDGTRFNPGNGELRN